MYIKLVIPFRCPFNIKTADKFSKKREYGDFWKRVSDTLPSKLHRTPSKLEFLHATSSKSGLKYSRIRKESITETICFSPDESVGQLAEKVYGNISCKELNKYYSLDTTSIEVKLFDNTVGIFEANIEINPAEVEEHFADILEQIETWVPTFIKGFMNPFYNEYLSPILKALWEIKGSKAFLQAPGESSFYLDLSQAKYSQDIDPIEDTTLNYSKFGEPLWISRTLCMEDVDPNDNKIDFAIENWLILEKNQIQSVKDHFAGGESIYLWWRHSLTCCSREDEEYLDAMMSLVLCQYFYTVFDYTEFKLSEVLGLSADNASSAKVRSNSIRLEEAITTINILLFQIDDTKLILERYQEKYFDYLRKILKLDDVMQNVQVKLSFCDDRIKFLHQRITNRSRVISEWLLFTIGGIALIDFIANLSGIALSLKPNYDVSANGEMMPGLLTMALKYEPNALLWGGVLILFVIVFVYTYLHARSQ